ncbi:Na(+), Li(+), K(+)/H(+) antiporter subunit A [Candidatus Magnetomoraceae bacterium gMMP-15]
MIDTIALIPIKEGIMRMIIPILKLIVKKLKNAFVDLMPIILVIAFFQLIVLKQPLPQIGEILFGTLLVVAGLSLFVQGLEMGLFPIGETMAHALAVKGSIFWLLIFAFSLGFSTTVAEPALIAVASEAAEIAGKEGLIEQNKKSLTQYAFGLRVSVAFSVGLAILIGVIRIIKGWSIHYLIIGGYIVVMLVSLIAPKEIIGIAYDAGGVTTSTITVPLVAAIGVGLSSNIRGRSPLVDGFGLIAFASLLPIVFVMVYGLIIFR